MGPFEVEAKHIEKLDSLQLTRLLKQLLHLEASANDISKSTVDVSLKINEPDKGEDGRIQWVGGPEKTDYIPNRFTLFQCKAQPMDKEKCKKEILIQRGKELKEKVKEVFNAKGTYALFCHKSIKEKKSRIDGFREGLKIAGRDDWETADIKIYDAEKIADWTNGYLPAVIYVLECNGRYIIPGLQSWIRWKGYLEYENKYFPNDKLGEYIKTIRQNIMAKGQIVQIVGLSGLGKTRLVLEAFKPSEDDSKIEQNILNNNVLYFDASQDGGELVNFICSMRNNNISGILVVDECEQELNRRLIKEVRRSDSNLSLVTLDLELESRKPDYPIIYLQQNDCRGVVRQIVKDAYPGLSDVIVSRIEELAQDFPSIAVFIAQQVDMGKEDIGKISDKAIVDKLLWGREPKDKDVISVITACSLFREIEFSEDNPTTHVQFLAKEIASVTEEKFREITMKFKKRGILQQKGRFIRVTPIPLAITLAAEWWDNIASAQAIEIVNKVASAGLSEQFCDQISKLHFSKKAQQLTEDLCGEKGPFGDAEVLNSEEGSRLFRSLVEVNPQATIDALERAFGGWTREQMLKVGPGRRNLVWSLEKLCWWAETFPKAAKLMLRLAAAENESWSNDATGQFKQLFQIYLPGTQANLNERLRIAREALGSEVKEERELGILAIGHAIETHSFSRGSRVESQGTRIPGRDYEPSGKEIQEYWGECISLLKDVIIAGGELSSLAQQKLGWAISGLLRNGMIDEIEAVVRDIVKEKGAYWPEALKSIRDCIDYDGVDMPTEIRERINSLEKILQPEGLGEKLHLVVSFPDWRNRKNEKGDYVSISAEEADKLARRLAGNNSWFKEVRVVLEGEQRQAYAFGKALGQSMPAGLRSEFIEICLNILDELGREKGNPDVLGAFLGSVSAESLVNETMGRVIQGEKLCAYAVWITRFLDLSEKHLLRLLPLIEQNKIPVSDIRVFSYGRALDKLTENFVTKFCQTIANHSQEGANCAIGILHMYCYQKDERFAKCAATFRNIVMRKDLLIGEKQSQMAGHNWEVVSNKLLRIDKDVELAKHLAEEIVAICGSDEVPWNNIHYNAKRVLEVLLKEYFDECWDIIGKALMSEDWRTRHYLEDIVGPGDEKEKSEALIAEISLDGLLNWCKKNLPHGPTAIAHLTPIFSSEKEKMSWHPLARKLIDEFGNIEEVRNNLSSNLNSFSSAGSRAPYFQRRIDLLSELSNHPIEEIREWASLDIKYFEKERDEARCEAEEREWGIH
jgi:hypothetical protein